jgi:hypothetical protein
VRSFFKIARCGIGNIMQGVVSVWQGSSPIVGRNRYSLINQSIELINFKLVLAQDQKNNNNFKSFISFSVSSVLIITLLLRVSLKRWGSREGADRRCCHG